MRVGDEPHPPGLVEAFRRPEQANVAFVHEVREREPVPLIPPRHRDHESKVCGGQPTPRLPVARSGPGCQLDFLFGRKQRLTTDIL